MTPIEEELRDAFARHEPDTPAAGPVHDKIQTAWVRAKRRRTLRRSASVAAAVVLATVSAPAALSHFRQSAAPVTAPAASSSPAVARPLDVLLVGEDDAGDADTVMLVHLPADRSHIYLVSVPRDTVGIRGVDGGRVPGAVSHLTGVSFDATVTVGFDDLRALAGAVGPVDVCLPAPANTNRFRTGRQFEAGCQKIGADDVAPLLRARYGLKEGLYDRDRNTQRFLRAVAAKMTADGTTTDPARLAPLLTMLRGDSEVWLQAAASLSKAEVVGISVPGGAALDSSRYLGEKFDAAVAPGLFAAIRGDTLAEWTAGHPDLLLD
ncbi:LCP family protein [Symbioplanes lichenis]|uniref:LCP family protein n=1 Tax=Symbioplanes lichenis TaxID=1629072 RepID=UPI0027383AB4|nr:LCP family protein [Actinoplanes lichenis]